MKEIEDKEIIDLYKKGFTNSQIAGKLQYKYKDDDSFWYISSEQIYRIIKKYGLNPNKYIFYCQECNKKSKSITIRSKFCSDKCRYKYHNKNKKYRYKPIRKKTNLPFKKICANCGEFYESKTKKQIFCSKQCRLDYKLIYGKNNIDNEKDIIDNMRFHFNRLKKNNQIKAKEIADEIEIFEGVKFRELALNGLIECKNPKVVKR